MNENKEIRFVKTSAKDAADSEFIVNPIPEQFSKKNNSEFYGEQNQFFSYHNKMRDKRIKDATSLVYIVFLWCSVTIVILGTVFLPILKAYYHQNNELLTSFKSLEDLRNITASILAGGLLSYMFSKLDSSK